MLICYTLVSILSVGKGSWGQNGPAILQPANLTGQPFAPTLPLYHTTEVLACQAFQMLNFCYGSVTKVLHRRRPGGQASPALDLTYMTGPPLINQHEKLEKLDLGKLELRAGTGPPYNRTPGWKLGWPAGGQLRELENQASWETPRETTPPLASWNTHPTNASRKERTPKILCREATLLPTQSGSWRSTDIGFSVSVRF